MTLSEDPNDTKSKQSSGEESDEDSSDDEQQAPPVVAVVENAVWGFTIYTDHPPVSSRCFLVL